MSCVHTGDTFYQTMPSQHAHKLAKVHRATPKLVQEAIESSQKARNDWARMPFEHRSMVFRKAGDLISGSWRDTVVPNTSVLTMSRACSQASIATR
jgi:1-pyrroline-5-carboxylate dehydrogenase